MQQQYISQTTAIAINIETIMLQCRYRIHIITVPDTACFAFGENNENKTRSGE